MLRLSSAALMAAAAALTTVAATGQRRTASGPADWAGTYSAHFEGDAHGEFTVVRQRDARAPYRLSMNVWTGMQRRDWCTGELAGPGAPSGQGRLTFAIPNISRQGSCHISLTRRRDGVRVEEDNCLDFHGFSCAFDGVAHKRR